MTNILRDEAIPNLTVNNQKFGMYYMQRVDVVSRKIREILYLTEDSLEGCLCLFYADNLSRCLSVLDLTFLPSPRTRIRMTGKNDRTIELISCDCYVL